ncbi:MAG: D-alanyl-D-alanine carboxypeptidase [Oscillospiraceae bacterium]|nr:D-alanyl-D-alanine carboxypeptidase [Oscillospiraceae bacterium]
MKKIISVLLCILIMIPLSVSAFAEEGDTVTEGLSATSAILMEMSTGKVLLSKNPDEKLPPASITKVMTLLLVMEALDSGKIALEDTVTASKNASSKGGSQIWLKEGEQMTVHELIKATAVASANDACTALGEYIAGNEASFVVMMNERAKELGMVNTNFENCSGLDDTTENHYSSARDIAIMSCELMKHGQIVEYTTIWMDSLRDGATELVNTNRLVRFYEGTTGLKTGTTSKAGYCVSATAQRDGMELVAVVLGSTDSTERFEDAKKLLNWGFANYAVYTPQVDASLITNVGVLYGVQNSIMPIVKPTDNVLIKKGAEENITQRVDICIDVEAPVEKGQKLGTVYFEADGEEIASCPIISENAVERRGLFFVFSALWSTFAKK